MANPSSPEQNPSSAPAQTLLRRPGGASRDLWFPLASTYPPLLVVLAFVIFPVVFEVVLSFSHRDAFTGEQHLIGWENYRRIVHDSGFLSAVQRTLLYAVASTALQLVIGTVMALYAFRLPPRPRAWLRLVGFLPYVLPAVSTVLVFDFLFDYQSGLATRVLSVFGGGADWHAGWRLFALLILVSTWQFAPFVFVAVLARLESIPRGMLEAAQVDGATAWQRFAKVLMPQLRETFFAVVVLRLVFMVTKFDTPWLLAGSRGTNVYVETLPVYAFRLAFEQLQFGDAAACGVMLFLASACAVLLATAITARTRPAS